MTATTSLNGQPRKQLSDQLDRMDGILDVLEEGLTGAVSEAMKAGTRVAVKEALVEILTHPEFLTAIRGVLPIPAGTAVPVAETEGVAESASGPGRPSLWSRLKAKLATARAATTAVCSRIKGRLIATGNAIRTGLAQTGRSLLGRVGMVKQQIVQMATVIGVTRVVHNVKRMALLAIGIGTATGVMSLLAPHALAAMASGATAVLTMLAVQIGLRSRGLARWALPVRV